MFDIAIIGAGMAGLTCAQQLYQAGYRVVVLEKSRGVGGRVATRRIQGTPVDHGVPFLEAKGKLSQQLIEILCDRGILHVWMDNQDQSECPSPRYVAPTGMTAIAKYLAQDLDIRFSCRVCAIAPTPEQTWQITYHTPEKTDTNLTAAAVVMAIPAPQALTVLEPLEKEFPSNLLESLRAVEFNPCLSVMAGYSNPQQPPLPSGSINCSPDDNLAWIGVDSSKRSNSTSLICVFHSTAEFAQPYLEAADLQEAGQQLLTHAAQILLPWLKTPDWFQIHRWRYAFPRTSAPQDCLVTTTPLPLVCCGDWCGHNLIESAMKSGLAAAVKINQQLRQLSLPDQVISFVGAGLITILSCCTQI